MPLDPVTCYSALTARDQRFDGVFFVGVETTGVYCRPVCPARTPRARSCRFFASAAEAETAGFRACFRCRPELAPGMARAAAVDAVERLARVAATRIEAGYLNDQTLDDLALDLGVTARHLRRAMERTLGVSPIALAQTTRLALARRLLVETRLPVTEVAFAAGFSSLRRFNALVRKRLGRSPSAFRRGTSIPDDGDSITLRLDYRPPLDWTELVGFLGARSIPGVDEVAGGVYHRLVRMGDTAGRIEVRPAPRGRAALEAKLSLSLVPRLPDIVARLRALFDLDAHPDAITAHLGRDPRLGRLLALRPGLRVPGAFDPFELAVRAVLGQQVSVRGATTLAGRLVRHFRGLFPTPGALAGTAPSAVQRLGMPMARAEALVSLAKAVATGGIDLGPGADPVACATRLQTLRGIGPWTAQYVVMRALRWPDAFPAHDLVVRKALGVSSPRELDERTQAWRPWRAYAVIHLWMEMSASSKKGV